MVFLTHPMRSPEQVLHSAEREEQDEKGQRATVGRHGWLGRRKPVTEVPQLVITKVVRKTMPIDPMTQSLEAPPELLLRTLSRSPLGYSTSVP